MSLAGPAEHIWAAPDDPNYWESMLVATPNIASTGIRQGADQPNRVRTRVGGLFRGSESQIPDPEFVAADDA